MRPNLCVNEQHFIRHCMWLANPFTLDPIHYFQPGYTVIFPQRRSDIHRDFFFVVITIAMPGCLGVMPPELLNKALQSFDIDNSEDWKALCALRTMNKALNLTVTPLVFETVPFSLGLKSLTNLTRIAEHSVM